MPAAPALPEPRRWPTPITAEQYLAFTPEKLELIEGYLLGSQEERLHLLSLLLANCGLEDAVTLASPEDWRDGLERSYIDF